MSVYLFFFFQAEDGIRDGHVTGVQTCALPISIISAVAVGMNRETALRFSFMLYIPVSIGGIVLGITDFVKEPNKIELIFPYSVAFFATLCMTFFSLKWFIHIMKKGKLIYFVYYCFIIGSILVVRHLI